MLDLKKKLMGNDVIIGTRSYFFLIQWQHRQASPSGKG